MKIVIQSQAWEKIMQFTMLATGEISGLGKVEKLNGHLTVTDVEIFEQTTSGAHSTIPTEALAKFQDDVVRAGGSMKNYTLWWHSHAHMAVFFSGTDTNTIDGSTEFPYLVSLVVNKKAEYKARLDIHHPVHLCAENIDVEILDEDDDEDITAARKTLGELVEKRNEVIKDLCQKEIDLKVKKPEHKPFQGFGGSGTGKQRQLPAGRNEERLYPRRWDISEDEVDYWTHKSFLRTQIQHLEKRQDQQGKDAYIKRVEEMLDHETYGKSMGYEVTRYDGE